MVSLGWRYFSNVKVGGGSTYMIGSITGSITGSIIIQEVYMRRCSVQGWGECYLRSGHSQTEGQGGLAVSHAPPAASEIRKVRR